MDPIPDFTGDEEYYCPSSIMMDGTNSQNETDHYWRMERLSTNNINSIVAGTDATKYFYNTPVGLIDVLDMYTNSITSSGQYGVITSGYYKITLGVINCSSGWITKVKMIYINTPNIVTNDMYRCCGDRSATYINASLITPYQSTAQYTTFGWYDSNGNYIGAGTTSVSQILGGKWMTYNTIQVPTNSNAKYKVKVTTIGDCIVYRNVRVNPLCD